MIELSFLEISQKIKKFKIPKIDMVVGIGSGGVVPASLIAHQLDKPLQIININFRNIDNSIKFSEPKLLKPFELLIENKIRILLVDDVSVTGSTLRCAKKYLEKYDITTLVMKGKCADFILFPEISECVLWPWANKS